MRLTVLGKSPAFTDADGACSGYLVERDGRLLLVDCGNGVFGKLRARVDHRDVEAVVISHLHGDHLLDLAPYAYALTVGARASDAPTPRLHAPPGARDFLRRLAGTWDREDLFERAFDLHEYESDVPMSVAGIEVTPRPVPHYGPTHALELRSPAGGRVVFGADGRRSDELVAAARGAAALIAEATLAEPEDAPLVERGHMAAEEAGEVARAAGVGLLVLTHISDQLDQEAARERAREAFGGEVLLAREGLEIGPY